MYTAWLCYPWSDEDDEDEDRSPVVELKEPAEWKYGKVIPISFTILHSWTDKDKELYR
jgi:hypothetical protein